MSIESEDTQHISVLGASLTLLLDTKHGNPSHYNFRKILHSILDVCGNIKNQAYVLNSACMTVKALKEITEDVVFNNMTQEVFVEAVENYNEEPYITKNVIHRMHKCEDILNFIVKNPHLTEEQILKKMKQFHSMYRMLCDEIEGEIGFELEDFNISRNMVEYMFYMYENVDFRVFTYTGFIRLLKYMARSEEF